VQKWLNRPRCRLGYVDSGPKEACVTWGAPWRHLANRIEKSMCGGDATFFCQITLNTCLTNIWSSLVASSIVPVSLTCTKLLGLGLCPIPKWGAYSIPQSYKPPAGSRRSLQMKNVRDILVISSCDEDVVLVWFGL